MITRVLPGVHVIDTYANVAVLNEQRLVLIDASMDAEPKKLLEGLKELKVQPKDLTSIILTHTHGDHVTGLGALKRLTNAKVAAHEIEAPFIAQETQYPGPPRPMTHQGVPVDVRLKEGQRFEGLEVFHAPGHTPGSMALLDGAQRLLLAGDSMRTEGGVGPMEDIYNRDPAQHRKTIKRLAMLDFDALVVGHGAPISKGAGDLVRAMAARL